MVGVVGKDVRDGDEDYFLRPANGHGTFRLLYLALLGTEVAVAGAPRSYQKIRRV